MMDSPLYYRRGCGYIFPKRWIIAIVRISISCISGSLHLRKYMYHTWVYDVDSHVLTSIEYCERRTKMLYKYSSECVKFLRRPVGSRLALLGCIKKGPKGKWVM